MLRKLMKYEIKATGRILIPLYVVLLAFAGIIKIFIGTNVEPDTLTLKSISMIISIFVYGCTMAAVFIVTFFIIVQRFYKNLLGDEGYLMNTLPVPIWKNICGKLFVAIIWNIVSGVVAITSVLILAYQKGAFSEFINSITKFLESCYIEIGMNIYLVAFEIIILMIMAMISSVMVLYASIALGHLSSKRRVLSAFGGFIVLSIITSTIASTIGKIILPNNTISLTFNSFQWVIVQVLLIHGVFIAGYYFICHYVMKNRLNLE